MSRPKRRKGGRVTPKRTRPRNWDDQGPGLHAVRLPERDEPPIVGEVREALDFGHPLALLSLGSSFAELAADSDRRMSMLSEEPGERSVEVSWQMLVEMFSGVDMPETTALLHALAPLAPEPWAAQLRLQLELRRHHRLPDWVRGLEDVEVTEVWEQGDVMRDGENVLLGVRWSTGQELTAVTYIDHNMGTVVKDFFTALGPPSEIVEIFEREAPQGGFQRRMDPAEGRARIDSATERWSRTWPPLVSEEWPIARPLLLWLASFLPEGAALPEWEELSEKEQDRLIDAFLSSPDGAAVRDDPDARHLIETFLWFGAGYGVADPFRWSPVRVELLLMDFIPRKLHGPTAVLAKAPDVLERFIPWALIQLGHRDDVHFSVIDARTEEALEALYHWAPLYLERVGADPSAWDEDDNPFDLGGKTPYEMAQSILAAMGDQLDPSAREHLEGFIALGPDPSERDYLLYELGGEEAAARVHDEPWPLEAIDRAVVPDDLFDRVEEIDRGLVAACEGLGFDDEHLTIARRVLTRVVERDPKALRRRGATGGWVAGLLVVVGDLNGLIGQRDFQVTKKAIAAAVGVKSIGSKDGTIGRAADLTTKYHHVDLLDVRNRRELLRLLADPDDDG